MSWDNNQKINKFLKLKPQFLLGLFLLVKICFAQSPDYVYWDSLQVLNLTAHRLTNSNLDSAEKISRKLFEIIKEPVDTLVLSDINSVRANIYYKKGDYENSLKYNLICLRLREGLNDTIRIGQTYTKLANIYYASDDVEKCRKYLLKSINWLRLAGVEEWFLANNFNTMALSYLDVLELDSAQKYFTIGLQCLEGAPRSYLEDKGNFFGNIATIIDLQGEPDNAITSLDSAIKINLRIHDVAGLAWAYNKKGEIALKVGDMNLAFRSLRKADSLSQYSSSLENRKNIQYGFFKYYLLVGKTDSALKYNERYYVLNDSVFDLSTQKNIQEAEAKYQTEKTKAELVLVRVSALELAAESRNKELWLWATIIAFIVLAIVFLISYRSYQNKRKLAQLELTVKESQLDEMMSNQESKAYSAMLRGQEEERERIAQDLHDRLGGTLAALKLTLRRPENQILDEDLEIVDKAVNEVRSIAHNLSSGILQKYGFNEALMQLKRTVERTGGVQFNIYLHPSVSALGQSVALELYRIIQELVSNSLRHANASEISIQTNLDENSFNLIYEDDGVGFNPKEVKNGIGLGNIKTRVKKLKGNLHIDAEKGRGVIFIIELTKRS